MDQAAQDTPGAELHPLDAEVNRAWERFAVALIASGVSDEEAKAISDAALDYALARIRALPLIGKAAQ